MIQAENGDDSPASSTPLSHDGLGGCIRRTATPSHLLWRGCGIDGVGVPQPALHEAGFEESTQPQRANQAWMLEHEGGCGRWGEPRRVTCKSADDCIGSMGRRELGYIGRWLAGAVSFHVYGGWSHSGQPVSEGN